MSVLDDVAQLDTLGALKGHWLEGRHEGVGVKRRME